MKSDANSHIGAGVREMSGSDDVLGMWEEQAVEAHALIARMHEDAVATIRSLHEGFHTSILLVPPLPQYPRQQVAGRGKHAGNTQKVKAKTNGDAGNSTSHGVDTHSTERYQSRY